MRRSYHLSTGALVIALALGCADQQYSPMGPPTDRAAFTARAAQGASHGIPLTEDDGSRFGTVNVTVQPGGLMVTGEAFRPEMGDKIDAILIANAAIFVRVP